MDTQEPLSDEKRQSYLRLMTEVNKHFQIQIRAHNTKSEAISYLQGRELSGEVAHEFQLGFAPEGWNILTESLSNPEYSDALHSLGMLKESDNGNRYDTFRNRIIFPIRNVEGDFIGFGGRVLGDEQPKYLNSPETPIFHKGQELYGLFEGKDAIAEKDKVIVVEGYMDVVALAQAQISNSVATMGTATTPDHIDLLKKHTSNIVFCFDGDKAGRAAAWKALETSLSDIGDDLSVQVLLLPEGEDPDTLVKKIGTDAFSALIDDAQTASAFILSTLENGVNLNRMDGIAKYINKLTDVMVDATPSLREELIVSVSEHEEISRDLVEQGLQSKLNAIDEKAKADEVNKNSASPRPAPTGSQSDSYRKPIRLSGPMEPMTLIRRAISLTVQFPDKALSVFDGNIENLDMPGAITLRDLVNAAKETPTTEWLLDSQMDSPHFTTVIKLSRHEHHLADDDVDVMLSATLDALHNESNSVRMDQLIAQASEATLSTEDQKELNVLLLGNTQ